MCMCILIPPYPLHHVLFRHAKFPHHLLRSIFIAPMNLYNASITF